MDFLWAGYPYFFGPDILSATKHQCQSTEGIIKN